MATEIGKVQTLIGTVEAIADDGSKRVLFEGGKVDIYDIISTGVASAISIQLFDGSVMDLGRQSQVVLDQERVSNDVLVLQSIGFSPLRTFSFSA